MCFSLGWIEQLLVWLVIICAIFAIMRLLLPFVLNQLGARLDQGGLPFKACDYVVQFPLAADDEGVKILIGHGYNFPLTEIQHLV